MTAKSHMTTTIAIVLMPLVVYPDIIDNYFNVYLSIFTGASIGALFPDIDEERSSIGRKLPLLAFFFKGIKHRTITHNVFVYLIIMSLGYYFNNYYIIGFGIGSILHILEDSVTNSGVNWAFKPLLNKFALLPQQLRFNTGETFENFIYFPSISIVLFFEIIFIVTDVFYLKG